MARRLRESHELEIHANNGLVSVKMFYRLWGPPVSVSVADGRRRAISFSSPRLFTLPSGATHT